MRLPYEVNWIKELPWMLLYGRKFLRVAVADYIEGWEWVWRKRPPKEGTGT